MSQLYPKGEFDEDPDELKEAHGVEQAEAIDENGGDPRARSRARLRMLTITLALANANWAQF